MPTNKEFLYSLEPHELTEWFESEHGSNDTLGAKKVVSAESVDANGANAASLKVSSEDTQNLTDSREKLESDMANILHSAYMYAWMHGHENRRGGSFNHIHREFFNLLDRQAAITERSWMEICGANTAAAIEINKQREELQAQVDKLTAERDAIAADLKECMELNDKLSDEREKWRGTCGMMLDAAHEIERIMAEMEAR